MQRPLMFMPLWHCVIAPLTEMFFQALGMWTILPIVWVLITLDLCNTKELKSRIVSKQLWLESKILTEIERWPILYWLRYWDIIIQDLFKDHGILSNIWRRKISSGCSQFSYKEQIMRTIDPMSLWSFSDFFLLRSARDDAPVTEMIYLWIFISELFIYHSHN